MPIYYPASGLVVSVLTSAAAGPATLIATAIIDLLDRAAADDAPGAPVPDGVDPAPSPDASRTRGASPTS
ncbi:hypothetical protein, partial [Curtobacterium sp. B8]|uniref:hypothetical protein n=1 Tax=Curtobacterium sp. B8 TaxID=95611 RepID=UPI001C9D7DB5